MSLLSRLIIAAFVLFLAYKMTMQLFDSDQLQKIELDVPEEIELDASRGYLIQEKQSDSLSYVLSQSPRKLWIASTPLLAGSNNKTATYPYNLIITVLDKNDNALFKKDFYQMSAAARLITLKNNSGLYPETFVAQSSLFTPGKTNSVHITLPDGATRLRVTQLQKGPEIRDIAIRAYQYVQRSSRVEPLLLWERLSDRQKRRLTEYYPFDESMLSNNEKANLAGYRWQPLVPSGDAGSDYQSQIIYRIPNKYIDDKKHQLNRYDHLVDAYKRVSFPLQKAGQYRIEGSHNFTDREFEVSMTWHNPNDSYQNEQHFRLNEKQFSKVVRLRPGLVTFTSSIPLSIDLFAITGEVEDHDHFSSTAVLTDEQTLEYSLHSGSNARMPVQIQVRPFAVQQLYTQSHAKLHVTTMRRGEAVDHYEIIPEFIPEENSQIANEEFFNWLGIAKPFYLNLESDIDKLRVSSNSPLLVSLFTRLDDVPAIRVLPEQRRDWYDYPNAVPDWFAVRPDNWSSLLNTGGVKLLKHYHRSLLAEQDAPDPDEAYLTLLSDFEKLELSDIIVKNPYPGQPVKIEENRSLNYASPEAFPEGIIQHQEPLNQRFFYLQKKPQTRQINWTRNGVAQKPLWVTGKWGLLDERSTGQDFTGALQFQAKDINFYISGVGREQAQWQQRRAALISQGDTIRLNAVKGSDEKVITLITYTTTPDPIKLSVAIKNIRKKADINDTYTVTNRLYTIQPREFYAGYQLAGQKRIVGRQSFSIIAGKDIEDGALTLSINHLEGDDVFLSVVTRERKPAPIVERYRTGLEH